MSQNLSGNPALNQVPVAQNRAGAAGGMVLGAVINKPVDMVQPGGGVQVMQQQLPPGMIALNPQQQHVVLSPHHHQQLPQVLHNHSSSDSITTSSSSISTLANTKEKTPMCLINELARFNKIPHQYTLTDEQGPAHKKTFYVKLKLGEEEYSASGASIKKAQHAAADIALEQTQYKHPLPKPPRGSMDGSSSGDWQSDSITPTVELNALAMKRGEPAIYHPIDVGNRQPHPPPHASQHPQHPQHPPHQQHGQQHPQFYPPQANMDFRGMYNQRYHYPRAPAIFYVSLKVGSREFVGEGRTRQAARHAAADKALKILRNLPLPSAPASSSSSSPKSSEAASSPRPEQQMQGGGGEPEDKGEESPDGLNGLIDGKDALKSEISLVHEIALKRSMSVVFEVIRESGPPHMRTFLTKCQCGELVCEAEGNSKKLSKKRAADKMLAMIRELPGIPHNASPLKPKKAQNNKKKNRNLIKVEKATPDYGVNINPISRLIQIQQAKKEKEPVYTLSAERGLPRRREFVMTVSVGETTCTGVGPNKKLAKRNAAENMLQLLGYSRPAPQPTKPAIKHPGSASSPPPNGAAAHASSSSDKKVTFMDSQGPGYTSSSSSDASTQSSTSSPHHLRHLVHQQAHYPMSSHPPARQLVPGVIFMSDAQRAQASGGGSYSGNGAAVAAGIQQPDMSNIKFSPQTTAAIAKELLDTGASPTAEAISKTIPNAATAANTPQSLERPDQQLQYLANVLGFAISYTDFPKGNNKNEFLSLVTLSTSPAQVIHGSGPTIEASHDKAAHTALLLLADDGLDKAKDAALPTATVTVKKEGGDVDGGKGAGDGLHNVDDVKTANSVESDMKKKAEAK